jgi:aminoglycoside-2''-adenylyltransferase
MPRRGVKTRRPVRLEAALGALTRHGAEFVVVGGWAVIAHGSQRLTRDLDIVVNPSAANCRRLTAALVELEAEHRLSSGRWVKLSPKADPKWLARDNHLFETREGGIDVFNKLDGVPTWKQARPRAIEVEAFGHLILVLDKDSLIRSKLAAGRQQDLADVAELTQGEGE